MLNGVHVYCIDPQLKVQGVKGIEKKRPQRTWDERGCTHLAASRYNGEEFGIVQNSDTRGLSYSQPTSWVVKHKEATTTNGSGMVPSPCVPKAHTLPIPKGTIAMTAEQSILVVL